MNQDGQAVPRTHAGVRSRHPLTIDPNRAAFDELLRQCAALCDPAMPKPLVQPLAI